jgi:iron only hydrogenase large subunit-like protein
MQDYDKVTNIPLEKDYIRLRTNVLKNMDKESKIRVSDENENLQNMYNNYMGEPDGVKANTLLHTNYLDKSSEGHNNSIRKRKKH